MKKLVLTLFFSLFSIYIFPQSPDRDVVSSSGDYFEGTNASSSWTFGELVTETYDNGTIILSQGFQQPLISIHGLDLDVLVFLEGPYSGGTRNTQLKDDGLIPLSQPYNVAPWNYSGTETVESIPENATDWVLIEHRDAISADQALSSSSAETKAAFVFHDGTVADKDGSSLLQFTSILFNNPYIIVWHRNHLGVLSADPPVKTDGIYTYGFSTSLENAFGAGLGYKLVDAGVYGMVGGDVTGDHLIDMTDKTSWVSEAGNLGYKNEGIDLDAQVDNKDKNDFIYKNQGLSTQVMD